MAPRAAGISLLACAVAGISLVSVPPVAQEQPTLRMIMAELGAELLDLTDAILREDYGRVAEAGDAIAGHPLQEPIVVAIRTTLGSDFQRFETIDMASHAAAAALADAARRGDADAVTQAHAMLLGHCVACHTRFRERLRPLSD